MQRHRTRDSYSKGKGKGKGDGMMGKEEYEEKDGSEEDSEGKGGRQYRMNDEGKDGKGVCG